MIPKAKLTLGNTEASDFSHAIIWSYAVNVARGTYVFEAEKIIGDNRVVLCMVVLCKC